MCHSYLRMVEYLLNPSLKSNRRGLPFLENKLLQLSFVNLFIVACTGILLRSIPLFSSFPLLYKNILHGHSHFALGGWLLPTSHAFLRWAFIYAILSGIGPFATGPLIALGLRDTTLYFDAIYFYLHFQYNGFFAFMVLAYLYAKREKTGKTTCGKAVFRLFNAACIPSFALSLLWTEHPVLFNWAGGIAASAQLLGLFFLFVEIRIFFQNSSRFNFLLGLPVGFLCLKLFLQWLSAFPVLNVWVQQRSVIVAYLHLVFLGCISMFVFFEVATSGRYGRGILTGIGFFLISFVSTEILLVLPSFSVIIPHLPRQLLISSLFFPLGALLMARDIIKMPCRRTCRAMPQKAVV